MVRGTEFGRSCLGRDGVHQEPRPPAGGGGGQGISGAGVEHAREKGWTSDEHFTVDGTLLEGGPA
jgi:hypothetical protein